MKRPTHQKYKFSGRHEQEHRRIAEKILGRPLKGEECVHHVDHNGLNNAHSNLVICGSLAYHNLLHARERALDACGNPTWRPCAFCAKYDDLTNMQHDGRSGYSHRECANTWWRQWYAKNKERRNARKQERYASDPAYRAQIKFKNRGQYLLRRKSSMDLRVENRRQRALAACGNPDFRKCIWCGEYSDPITMRAHSKGVFIHIECSRARQQQRNAQHRLEGA